MMNLNCEYIRDVYPDVVHGKLDADVTLRVREHIATCRECALECALLDAIVASDATLPAGLHERVMAVATQPRARTLIRPAHLAMAATVAVALIGGAVIFETQRQPATPQPRVHAPAATIHVGSVGVDATMMSGKGSLDDLSVEQLEKLLGEMES